MGTVREGMGTVQWGSNGAAGACGCGRVWAAKGGARVRERMGAAWARTSVFERPCMVIAAKQMCSHT